MTNDAFLPRGITAALPERRQAMRDSGESAAATSQLESHARIVAHTQGPSPPLRAYDSHWKAGRMLRSGGGAPATYGGSVVRVYTCLTR